MALWATQRLFPMARGGEFARGLENGRKAALALFDYIQADSRFWIAFPTELNIIIWAPQGRTDGEISAASKAFFEVAAQEDLHLAEASFPKAMLESDWGITWSQEQINCLRSCLMKAEHEEWVERIWQKLSSLAHGVSQAL